MNISIVETENYVPNRIPFELIRINWLYTEVNWQPAPGKYDGVSWKRVGDAIQRLVNKVHRGDTITSLVVTTLGNSYDNRCY